MKKECKRWRMAMLQQTTSPVLHGESLVLSLVVHLSLAFTSNLECLKPVK